MRWQEFAAQWSAHGIEALKAVTVIYVGPDEIQRATPRMAHGARAICDALEQVRAKRREKAGNKAPLKKREIRLP